MAAKMNRKCLLLLFFHLIALLEAVEDFRHINYDGKRVFCCFYIDFFQ